MLQESQGHGADGAVTLLGDEEFGAAFALFFLLVVVGIVFFAPKKADEIGVLLDGAGFTQIAQARAALAVAGAGLGITVELGQDDDGNLQLLGAGP